MNLPEKSLEFLYKGDSFEYLMEEFEYDTNSINGYKNEEVYWLNTPGPFYTTQTDNCGTGQIESPENVGGDEDYYEFIFKQPYTKERLKEVATASYVDPFGAYYIDGNQYWTNERIIDWWSKFDKVIDYMVGLYSKELKLPSNPHESLWNFNGKIEVMHLFGPSVPIPLNYKCALDFYQNGLKEYLEWYMKFNSNETIKLKTLDYDWSKKEMLDLELLNFNPQKKELLKEYLEQQEKKNKSNMFYRFFKK